MQKNKNKNKNRLVQDPSTNLLYHLPCYLPSYKFEAIFRYIADQEWEPYRNPSPGFDFLSLPFHHLNFGVEGKRWKKAGENKEVEKAMKSNHGLIFI